MVGEGLDRFGIGLLQFADGAAILAGAIVLKTNGRATAFLAIALETIVLALCGECALLARILEAIVCLAKGGAATVTALSAPTTMFANGAALAFSACGLVVSVEAYAIAIALFAGVTGRALAMGTLLCGLLLFLVCFWLANTNAITNANSNTNSHTHINGLLWLSQNCFDNL